MRASRALTATALGLAFLGCEKATEAPRVELAVVTDGGGLVPVITDLGYEVELTEARVAVRDVAFTIAGEAHTASESPGRRLADVLVPRAHAHPGHYQGGEVTGELRGRFVVDWTSGEEGEELGVATLLAGTYSAANFAFDRGSEALLGADDPLVGHTALLRGTASRGGSQLAFVAVLDAPEDRQLVGAPFDVTLDVQADGEIRVRLETLDALEGDTLFDGVDFLALDGDDDGMVRIAADEGEAEEAYNTLRRTFQTHDHYSFIHHQE